jgi:hypothetical protein
MKIKPQPPRSCLGWLGWVSASLLLIFAISFSIDMARLAIARHKAYTLATKLGYTPARHLTDKGSTRLNHLLLGTAICRVGVFFTTPLDPSDFAVRLDQVVTSLRDGSLTSGRNMYVQIPFFVNGNNTLKLSFDQTSSLPPVYEHEWFVVDTYNKVKQEIFYSELSQANVEIEYEGRPITENVAYVGVDAGSFPFWVWIGC